MGRSYGGVDLTTDDRPRKHIVALLLIPTALLVSAALVLLRMHFQPPTVPPYSLVSDAGTAVLEVHRGGQFSLEVEPTGEVTGAVGARGFLLRGNEVRAWSPPFEVERDATVRVAGPVDTLFAGVPAGDWEVAVAVGRPENLPTTPRQVLRARDQEHGTSAWRLVLERIRLG